MKRLHVHVSVGDLDQSAGFYSTMFGDPPTIVKIDYAKWMLDDPQAGPSHLGVQAEDAAELAEISGRPKPAGSKTFDETGATCCYARSDKTWVEDPAGIRWETFHTFGEATDDGEDRSAEPVPKTASTKAAAA